MRSENSEIEISFRNFMKEKLLNEATIERYKLNQIPALTHEECVEALQLLNYLWRRADEESKKELAVFIDAINLRVASKSCDPE
ncbi:hypothetical protein I5M27_08025 [Adhaeribacter sp. BT258]|uniref:Uncharacterized protein n=1 Tax=Adhaeribacter terrigena TaxID=2793070 RepID=A0ABS1C0K2_9BACT|nr:hypothetical protein [Adhaeribacter terrigena]MBK0402931.1 hypothetical protein [Adhaeribacter terrigena]